MLSVGVAMFISSAQAISAPDFSSEASRREYWSVQLENDVFAHSGDRYYTHGTQVSRMTLGHAPPWLEDIATLFPAFQRDGVINGVNYSIGQKIFTPDNTDATELVVNDRPYAGYLYFSAALLSRVPSHANVDTGNLLEFTVGVVGPSALAEEVNTGYHDLAGLDISRGWDNQLSNEPAVGISYSRFWRQIQPLSGALQYGMTPHVNMALGNVYSYAATGAMFRLGTHLDNDLAPPNIGPGFPGLSLFRSNQQSNWYLFAGMEGRAVARNIFLDGNSFRDSHSVDKKPLVGDFQFGFVFQVGNIRFSLSEMIRTKEYEEQQDKTKFGAINISFLM